MNKNIEADNWQIMYFRNSLNKKDTKNSYRASIEYTVGDEQYTVNNKFDTFEEAYNWIKNKIIM